MDKAAREVVGLDLTPAGAGEKISANGKAL
jgi:hypothetical protein